MNEFATVLAKTLGFVRASPQEGWAQARPTEEIARSIEAMIVDYENGAEIDFFALRVLYLPTGELQELSLSNGWSDDYVSLAGEMDELLWDGDAPVRRRI
jgi:hypothetical protein